MNNSDIIEIKIKDYENYTINILGEIKNIKTGRILKYSTDKDGYYKIGLSKNSVQKIYSIHRLIAQHFIPNPENKPFIDHKDNNKKNNSIDNLRWCSSLENNRNVAKKKGLSSIYKGVCFDKKTKKWRVSIRINNTKKYLGLYTIEEEGAKVYDNYIIYHNLQEYFKLNF